MNETSTAVRKALGRDARDLERLNHRVRRLLRELPASSCSEGEDLPEAGDEAAALRADLQCVLADHLEPAARVLRSATELPGPGGEREPAHWLYPAPEAR